MKSKNGRRLAVASGLVAVAATIATLSAIPAEASTVAPYTMAAPSAKAGYLSASASWKTAKPRRGVIVRYDVKPSSGDVVSYSAASRTSGWKNLAADVAYKFRTRAVAKFGGKLYTGSWSASSAAVTPYAGLGVVTFASATPGYRSVAIGWTSSAPSSAGQVEKVQLRGDASGEYAADGSVTIATAQGGDTKCIQARAYAAGQWGGWSSKMCGTAQARTLDVSWGGSMKTSYCWSSACKAIHVAAGGFSTGTHTLWFDTDCAASTAAQAKACKSGGSNAGLMHYASMSIKVDSTGHYDSDTRAFGYKGASVWVDMDGVQSNHIKN